MFNNPGKKLKTLATILFVLGIIGSIALAFFWGPGLRDLAESITILIVGSLASYVWALCLYGFGELLEKIENTRKNTDEIRKSISLITVPAKTPESERTAAQHMNEDKQENTGIMDSSVPGYESHINDAPVAPIKKADGGAVCPKCGKAQKNGIKTFCWNCGVRFLPTTEEK